MSDKVKQPVRHHRKIISVFLGFAACLVLFAVYIFQQFNVAALLCDVMPGQTCPFERNTVFVINRTVRVLLNDAACMVLIFAIFKQKKYLQVAFYVFLFEALVLLPAYFMLKLSLEGDSEISSPLLSQIHRMIVNPTLMIVLIIAFAYQRFTLHKDKRDDV